MRIAVRTPSATVSEALSCASGAFVVVRQLAELQQLGLGVMALIFSLAVADELGGQPTPETVPLDLGLQQSDMGSLRIRVYAAITHPEVTTGSIGGKMKIGELATLAGCPVETVRYYEKEGLLTAALRNAGNNYRDYDEHHLNRLTFIRRCRALDMTHHEIRALLQARVEPDASCDAINELIDGHLHHVQQRIAELQALVAQLVDLRSHCDAVRATRDCGILRELEQPSDGASATHDRNHTAMCRGQSVHHTFPHPR